ncbi:MAG: thioredoxin domain-containing protein [Patescibacteria group bacterium]|jgi:protein-disulfide isomerase
MPKIKNGSGKLIFFSLTALALFAAIIFFIMPALFESQNNLLASNGEENFYLNEEFKEDDPLLTVVPNLDDMITGPIITDNDPSVGPEKAKINIVAYTDFQCSYCCQAVNEAKKIQQEMPELVKFIHKDFPSRNQDNPSFKAAVAGRCAYEQDEFWKMSDLLYQNGESINENLLLSLAKNIGLNLKKFSICLNGDKAKNYVMDNIEEANALKIIGIPLFYINEREILGEINYDELKKIIEQELNK